MSNPPKRFVPHAGYLLLLFLLLLCDWIALSVIFQFPGSLIGVESRVGIPFTGLVLRDGGPGTGIESVPVWPGLLGDVGLLLLLAVLCAIFSGPRRRDPRPAATARPGVRWSLYLDRPVLYAAAVFLWCIVSAIFMHNGIAADGMSTIGLPAVVVSDAVIPPQRGLIHTVNWAGALIDLLAVIVIVEGARLATRPRA